VLVCRASLLRVLFRQLILITMSRFIFWMEKPVWRLACATHLGLPEDSNIRF
jgi:hypothetical protein